MSSMTQAMELATLRTAAIHTKFWRVLAAVLFVVALAGGWGSFFFSTEEGERRDEIARLQRHNAQLLRMTVAADARATRMALAFVAPQQDWRADSVAFAALLDSLERAHPVGAPQTAPGRQGPNSPSTGFSAVSGPVSPGAAASVVPLPSRVAAMGRQVLASCGALNSTCAERAAADSVAKDLLRQQLATQARELVETRKLVPSRRSRLWHDVKLGAVSGGLGYLGCRVESALTP